MAQVFPLEKTRSRRREPHERDRLRCPRHITRLHDFPCSVPSCWNRDVIAHHLTCGPESKARGEKASDCFAVPLCNEHHLGASGVHVAGDERAWWAERCLDPLAIAAERWRQSVREGLAGRARGRPALEGGR